MQDTSPAMVKAKIAATWCSVREAELAGQVDTVDVLKADIDELLELLPRQG